MLTIGQAFYQLKDRLAAVYGSREAETIAHEVMEHITDQGRLARLMVKDTPMQINHLLQLNAMEEQLLAGTPLQYVLGYGWFMGRKYTVTNAVLIPRPETEELVDWICTDCKTGQASILDIGTGSGCIPVALKLALPGADITSIDVSAAALEVANSNALEAGVTIDFRLMDFLDSSATRLLPQWDVIVSNPPYIPVSKKELLDKNVRDFEPGLALFVPDDDPLLFYRAIARFGLTHLKANGSIYCEMESSLATDCGALFAEMGYSNTEIRRDMHGNFRMLKAVIPA